MQESEKRKELRMGQISGGLLLGCFEDEKVYLTPSPLLFNLPSFTPPVRATVGEVRYSIEIDVGGE